MAVETTGKILEGVFAIHKPPHLSSAQVLRDLQTHFTPSKLFAPLLENERRKREELDRQGKQRRRHNPNEGQVKVGHGGTLDPLATGILIVGVGKGTSELPRFLGCTKTYKTVVLFGKGTDTYDIAGKIVASAPYEHVTRELATEALSKFRGKIQQAPPIFSAIKVNGMKAYEYARSGKELPKELAPRAMEVAECKLLEWHEGGTHDYRWPAEEAPEEEKEVARKLIQDTKPTPDETVQTETRKRKTFPVGDDPTESEVKRPKTKSDHEQPDSPSSTPQSPALLEHSTFPSSIPPPPPSSTLPPATRAQEQQQHIHAPPPSSASASPAPACTISLTVSSGFYVRSFAHDLGLACDSLGIMASLVRSRQGDFALDQQHHSATASTTSTTSGACASDSAPPTSRTSTSGRTSSYPVLQYADLALGESHWGPKLAAMLERWNADHPPGSDDNETNSRFNNRDPYPRNRDRDRDRNSRRHNNVRGFSAKRGFDSPSSGRGYGYAEARDRDRGQGREGGGERRRERRNTSSEED